METGARDVANVDQARSWDGADGDNWTDHEEVYNAAVRSHTPVLMAAAAIAPADAVLDVGCGCGETTRLAARAAPRGIALGVDLSSRMIGRARERAEAEGLANARFEHGDAQVYPFERARFDVAISRFGSTFFADPVAAYSNIAAAMRGGGRLAMLCWQDLRSNDWVSSLRDALSAGRVLPEPPPTVGSPFAFAAPDRAREVLERSGFSDVTFGSVEEPVYFGTDADEAYNSIVRLGIVGALTRDLDERAREDALMRLRETVEAHATEEGVLFGSKVWLVRAGIARG